MVSRLRRQLGIGTAATIWLLLAGAVYAQPVNKVLLGEAMYMELPATSRLVGSVRPNRVSLIGAEVEGLVAALPVRRGDYLKAGDLICRLKDDILRLELQAAQNKLASLKAAVDIAVADLDRWELEKQRVESLEIAKRANAKEMYDTLADFLMAQNRVREARQAVAEQEALVQLKEVEIGKTNIPAPFDGYVTELHTEVGQWLERGGQVVEMIDLEVVLVRVDAPESAIAHIQIGDEARIKFDALDGVFEGRGTDHDLRHDPLAVKSVARMTRLVKIQEAADVSHLGRHQRHSGSFERLGRSRIETLDQIDVAGLATGESRPELAMATGAKHQPQASTAPRRATTDH